jgi:putative membrane protein
VVDENSKREVDPRVLLAAERTLLAWIRTGISLMGFGFVVARFGVFLRELAGLSGHGAEKPVVGGASIGVLVVAAGVLVNLWASLRHRQLFQRLARGDTDIGMRGPVFIGVATGVGGLLLLIILLRAIAG